MGKMASKIPQFTENCKHLGGKGLLWEMVKIEIRSFTVKFANLKQKAKKRKDDEKILTQEAEKLQNLVDDQPTPKHVNEFVEIRNGLFSVLFEPAALVSAAKRNGMNSGSEALNIFSILKKEVMKIIMSLTEDDQSTVTDPKDVLEELLQRRFYCSLYSSQNPSVCGPGFNSLFANDSIKTSADEEQNSCEGLLTESECKNPLKGFQKKDVSRDRWLNS